MEYVNNIIYFEKCQCLRVIFFVRVATFSITVTDLVNSFSDVMFLINHFLIIIIDSVIYLSGERNKTCSFSRKNHVCLVRSMCFTSNLRRVLNTRMSQYSHQLVISSDMSERLLSPPISLFGFRFISLDVIMVYKGSLLFISNVYVT